jgi:hypothetical protein
MEMIGCNYFEFFGKWKWQLVFLSTKIMKKCHYSDENHNMQKCDKFFSDHPTHS